MLINLSTKAQESNLLEQSITLDVREQTVANILRLIEEQAKFTFVYSTNQVNVSSIKTLKVSNSRIREVLNMLFENKVVYKQRGNHIILQPSPTASRIRIDGYIIDGITNKKISQASIFDKVRRVSAISNKYGYYVLQLEPGKDKLKLFVNKQNYKDTVVYVAYQNNKSINIEIYPAQESQDSTGSIDTTRITIDSAQNSIDNFALVKLLTSELEQVHSQNIKDTMHRRFQVSFLPYIGTNMHLSGQVVNDVSLNILGGYNMGVTGTEVGLFMNMNRGDVKKIQVAGFGNINGGHTSGFQAAGFLTLIKEQPREYNLQDLQILTVTVHVDCQLVDLPITTGYLCMA
ncbi:MAG: STN domain-containing protein [Bacteroidetes bacterium]|nr:STN domain-containing protein [Bacteroidota bacterium]